MSIEINKSDNRVALITGSTSGIGKAIASQLAGEGYQIVYHSRSSVDVGKELAQAHPRACYIQADLLKQDDISNLISEIIKRYGRLDVLINNAGINAIIPHGSLQEATPDIWRKLYEVNVVAAWSLISEAEDALRKASSTERPSNILNITSHAGVRPKGGSIPYAVSKAALNHMTKLLALSLSPEIRVNAVAPGLVNTPMTENWVEAQNLWNEKSPMKRAARPEEIAQVTSMIIANDYLTGEIIMCDGGLNLT